MVQPISDPRPAATQQAATSPPPAASTLSELRASGHVYRTVKDELRQNLLARMRAGQNRFPGIIGFDQTVLPHLERSLLAGHDVILLGERGQGKTRLIRTITNLLDEWCPAVPPPGRVGGRRASGGLAARGRALRREARHPGH